jgi:hypothetical protein
MIPLFMSFVALPIFGLGCGYVGTCVWISHGVSFEMMQKPRPFGTTMGTTTF